MLLLFFDLLVENPAPILSAEWQLLVLEERPADHGPTSGMSKEMVFDG
jgi:hypothetical protein